MKKMIQISRFMQDVYIDCDNAIYEAFKVELKRWDESTDMYCAFYEIGLLKMLLRQVKEDLK